MEIRNGIHVGAPKAPSISGLFSGPALVLGGARCVWQDLAALGALLEKPFDNRKGWSWPVAFTVFAVNDIVTHYKPRVHHLVSFHEDGLEALVELRRINDCREAHIYTHTNRHALVGTDFPLAQFEWHFEHVAGGTSGLLATRIALALGCEKVILAGVPLDNGGHYFDPPGQEDSTFTAKHIALDWTWCRDNEFQGRVRSLSGQTAYWLGTPDKEWIENGNADLHL